MCIRDRGKVVDTSMGMTPLAGLMMGTRCGDLDPSVVNYLKYTLNITGHQLEDVYKRQLYPNWPVFCKYLRAKSVLFLVILFQREAAAAYFGHMAHCLLYTSRCV